jgi:RNA polymerase sigma factor (sigma-70 family)
MKDRGFDKLPDEELVRVALAEHDRPPGGVAASALLERYQERVYVWCYRMVGEHEQALDLAQETLLSAYRGLASFEGRSGFASWLFVITRNCCLAVLRRPAPLWEEEKAIESLSDPRPRPDDRLERKIDEEAALDLVQRHLDPVEREALWLRCYEGLPVDDITRLLSIDAATGARGVLQRARRKLRAALGADQGESRNP